MELGLEVIWLTRISSCFNEPSLLVAGGKQRGGGISGLNKNRGHPEAVSVFPPGSDEPGKLLTRVLPTSFPEPIV